MRKIVEVISLAEFLQTILQLDFSTLCNNILFLEIVLLLFLLLLLFSCYTWYTMYFYLCRCLVLYRDNEAVAINKMLYIRWVTKAKNYRKAQLYFSHHIRTYIVLHRFWRVDILYQWKWGGSWQWNVLYSLGYKDKVTGRYESVHLLTTIFLYKFALLIIYSWHSLSRPRLSRITAYFEVKIWSLPKGENLITGNKILWKRGEKRR